MLSNCIKGNGGLWAFPDLSPFTALPEPVLNPPPPPPPLWTQKDCNSSRKHKYYASLIYFQGLYYSWRKYPVDFVNGALATWVSSTHVLPSQGPKCKCQGYFHDGTEQGLPYMSEPRPAAELPLPSLKKSRDRTPMTT